MKDKIKIKPIITIKLSKYKVGEVEPYEEIILRPSEKEGNADDT